jgi:hypothetical protein
LCCFCFVCLLHHMLPVSLDCPFFMTTQKKKKMNNTKKSIKVLWDMGHYKKNTHFSVFTQLKNKYQPNWLEKTCWCSIRLYLQLFVGGIMSNLRYLCLFAHSGVQHILCCFCFVCLLHHMLPVSLKNNIERCVN